MTAGSVVVGGLFTDPDDLLSNDAPAPITAEPAGRHGLIGPFSAGTHDKVSADQGFPRPGKRSRTDRHVRIAASEYEDLCHTIR